MCYDLIPLLHPEWFPRKDVDQFRKYWMRMMSAADLIIFNSRQIEADAQQIASREGLQLGATAVAPLGFRLPDQPEGSAPLREWLREGKYALFVSTIEPRKGHGLLLRVWKRLLERNIPQEHGFRLVFVGREGWMVAGVVREITSAVQGGSVVWLRKLDDVQLDRLYRAAAFCVYPSRYEGFGLPVVEAFARGKAVIASNAGALREIVGELSPSLDPLDEKGWEEILAAWIEDPRSRTHCEERIRAEFSHPSWSEAARNILSVAGSKRAS